MKLLPTLKIISMKDVHELLNIFRFIKEVIKIFLSFRTVSIKKKKKK